MIIGSKYNKLLLSVVVLSLTTLFLLPIFQQKALAASFYWIGGDAGGANNWSNGNNWSTMSGGSGGAGVPGSSDTVVFDNASSVNCNLSAITSIGSVTNSGYTGTLGLLTYAFTISDGLTWGSGTISAGSSQISIGGNLNLSGGTFTYSTSRITMTGANKTINIGTNGLYDLTIAGSSQVQSAISMNHNLTVDAAGVLSVDLNRTVTMKTATTTTLNGQITGLGTMEFIQTGISGLSTGGTLGINVKFSNTTTTNVVLPARTYGGSLTLVPAAVDFNLRFPTGTTTISGDFVMTRPAAGRARVDTYTYVANVNINGDFLTSGTFGASFFLGKGTVNFAGNVDARAIYIEASIETNTSTVNLNGSNKNFYMGQFYYGLGFYNVNIVGQITLYDSSTEAYHGFRAFHGFSVASGGSITIATATDVLSIAGSTFTHEGTINGPGDLKIETSVTVPKTGVINCDVIFKSSGNGVTFNSTARTYGGNLTINIYSAAMNFADASGGTVNIAGDFTLIKTSYSTTFALNNTANNLDFNVGGKFTTYTSGCQSYVTMNMGASTWTISGETYFCGVYNGSQTNLVFNQPGQELTCNITTTSYFNNISFLENVRYSGNWDLRFSGNMFVASGKTFKIADDGEVIVFSGGTITNQGVITTVSYGGSFFFVNTTNPEPMQGSGVYDIDINYQISTAETMYVQSREYTRNVTVYNASTTLSKTVILGTGNGQTVKFNGLVVSERSGGLGILTLDASTYNPNVVVRDYISFPKYTDTNIHNQLNLGSGTWTVSTGVDMNDSAINPQTATIVRQTIAPSLNQIGTLGSVGDIYNTEQYKDNLIIAGDFSYVDGVAVESMAMYKNGQFSQIGDGVDNGVYDILADGDNLFACGYFEETGSGLDIAAVAKWDGNAWSKVGDLTSSDYCSSLALYNGDLYAGGGFPTKSGVVVKYNSLNNTWDNFDLPAADNLDGTLVSKLIVYQDNLYASAEYRYTSPAEAVGKYLAYWDGVSWRAVPNGPDDDVYDLELYENKLIVGGSFSNVGSLYSPFIASWDGSTWSNSISVTNDEDGTGYNYFTGANYTRAMTVSNGKLYNIAEYDETTAYDDWRYSSYLSAWDGDNWTRVANASSYYVYAMGSYCGNLALVTEEWLKTAIYIYSEDGDFSKTCDGTSPVDDGDEDGDDPNDPETILDPDDGTPLSYELLPTTLLDQYSDSTNNLTILPITGQLKAL